MTTLLFSPIRQDSPILRLFLSALSKLEGIDEFLFVDDNDELYQGSKLLSSSPLHPRTIIPGSHFESAGSYSRTGSLTHEWNEPLTERITAIRNFGLDRAIDSPHDYLFSVDSDVILHPQTARHLVSLDKDIVSEVYWTRWRTGWPWMPQVWDIHPYLFESEQSIRRLTSPGTFRVNGLGGCTLVSLNALHRKGEPLDYSRIPGLDLLGEDRHFCIRAAALGLSLWADTHFPPFHVYRPAQLPEATRWFESGCDPTYFRREWQIGTDNLVISGDAQWP